MYEHNLLEQMSFTIITNPLYCYSRFVIYDSTQDYA